ncbi:MAG: hypothetical protein JXP48_04660, partial [Acidobacteria bacterium]|nr:hypothetical protein [Acidobacteriota bacterium]
MVVLRPPRWILFLLLMLLPVAASAQQSPAPKEPTPSTPSTPSVPAAPTAPKIVPQPGIFTVPDFRPPPREIQPIFLAGNVMREDGSPPP